MISISYFSCRIYFLFLFSSDKLIFISNMIFLKDGWTPLHLAVQTKRTDIVRLLLIKGADRTLKNRVNLPTYAFFIIAYSKMHCSIGCSWFCSGIFCKDCSLNHLQLRYDWNYFTTTFAFFKWTSLADLYRSKRNVNIKQGWNKKWITHIKRSCLIT